MIERYNSGGLRIVQGDAREVSQTIEPGSCSLAILDGPYGLGKAEWDRVADLPTWYAPHLDDVGRVCGASASLYVWNTAEGWAALHPGIVARGWTFRALVTWDKGVGFMAGKVDTSGLRTWYDVTEVCGFYQREAWTLSGGAGSTIAHAANADPRNLGASFLVAEREAAGMTRRDLSRWFPSATGGLTGCVSNWEGGQNFPTWAVWERCAEAMTTSGPPRDRPYLVHPSCWPGGDLRASYDHLRAEYDHLRAEYEASRPAFVCPVGVSNVWTAGQVSGPERLRAANGETLHPCQKPLAFAERMIRASTRPGERVWVPFGGTCREAVAAQRIARADATEAREVVTAELDEDGRGYLEAVVRVLDGRGVAPEHPRQASLFGGGP
ncbi:MAG: DNA methyltransferase [Candidatus Nanopelagicales bacterium]